MTGSQSMPPVAHSAYRRLAVLEMPDEIKLGLNLAFYRTFGIPSIAAVLASTGEITGRPLKRADDTGLIMYLLIYYGFDHPRGQAVLARLKGMHHRHQIANEDYLYVLACVAVVPARWVAQHGPRPLTAMEKAATHAFYHELATHMGVRDIPDSYEGLEEFADSYEHRNMHFSEAGRQLMQASTGLLAERFPRWLRPLAKQWPAAMLDARLRTAVGVPKPTAIARWSLALMLRTIRAFSRRKAAFDPVATVRSYPRGYTIDDLGPPGI